MYVCACVREREGRNTLRIESHYIISRELVIVRPEGEKKKSLKKSFGLGGG